MVSFYTQFGLKVKKKDDTGSDDTYDVDYSQGGIVTYAGQWEPDPIA